MLFRPVCGLRFVRSKFAGADAGVRNDWSEIRLSDEKRSVQVRSTFLFLALSFFSIGSPPEPYHPQHRGAHLRKSRREQGMRSKGYRERRRSSRVGYSCSFTGGEAIPLGVFPRQERLFEGRIENISAGGICVLAKERPKESQMIHCQVHLPGFPIAIPTLMQVRWTLPSKQEFRIGLEFLL
jgi:hypothetical protein